MTPSSRPQIVSSTTKRKRLLLASTAAAILIGVLLWLLAGASTTENRTTINGVQIGMTPNEVRTLCTQDSRAKLSLIAGGITFSGYEAKQETLLMMEGAGYATPWQEPANIQNVYYIKERYIDSMSCESETETWTASFTRPPSSAQVHEVEVARSSKAPKVTLDVLRDELFTRFGEPSERAAVNSKSARSWRWPASDGEDCMSLGHMRGKKPMTNCADILVANVEMHEGTVTTASTSLMSVQLQISSKKEFQAYLKEVARIANLPRPGDNR